MYTYTTQPQIRRAFWQYWLALHERSEEDWTNCPRPKRQRDGHYPADVRCAFVDFVEMLARDGQISEALAYRVAL